MATKRANYLLMVVQAREAQRREVERLRLLAVQVLCVAVKVTRPWLREVRWAYGWVGG